MKYALIFFFLFLPFVSFSSPDISRQEKYINEIALAQKNYITTNYIRHKKIFTQKNYLIALATLAVVFLGVIAFRRKK